MAAKYTSSPSSRKLALLIGNGNYQTNNKLPCSINNAKDLTKVLQSIQFTTTTVHDVSREEMAAKIKDFLTKIADGDLVLFYFSGHVYQADGQKYLIPINDANIQEDDDFEDMAISFDRNMKRLVEKTPSYGTVFILDYCSRYELRNSQTNASRTVGRGLSEMHPLPETFIQFACGASQTGVTQREPGRNSLFTRHLLQNIASENVPITEVFRRVADGVYQESNGKQKPLSMNGLRRYKQLCMNEVIVEQPPPTRLDAKDFLSKTPLSSAEKQYYDRCKNYYHITGKPLISVADEVLDKSTASKSSILKLGIDEDFNQFDLHKYRDIFCHKFNIHKDDFVVQATQMSSVIITVEIFGKSAPKDRQQGLKLIFHSCTKDTLPNDLGQLKTFFMFLGPEEALMKMQTHQAQIMLNPRFNRVYTRGQNFWLGAMNDGKDRGGQPYYCPVGWKRWSFYVTDNFDQKFSGWSICYHGTKFAYGLSILFNGMKPARIKALGDGIYTTPSIIYASHPRYAEVKSIPSSARNIFKSGAYVQYVLECRVQPHSIKRIGCETLKATQTRIDPNIRNEEIEWVIDNKKQNIVDFNDPNAPMVCTGLMIRVTDDHPGLLPEAQWWYESHLCDKKQCCYIGIDLPLLQNKRQSGHKCNIIDN